MATDSDFEIRFSNREVTAWGGLALLKRMLTVIGFRTAARSWDLPQPGSNRGYPPIQIIEQFIVSIWCGANRFAHAEITRFDKTLTRLFEWKYVAGHKSIVRLFAKFDMARNENVQAQIYRWIFDHIRFDRITLDMDSTVITRYGTPEGGAKGYNAAKPGRLSHHPLLAFVAECRMVANFWLRPGNSSSANNTLQFLESTLHHLENKIVGLLRADSGFYDDAILTFLQGRHIDYIISAKLTHGLQRAIAEQVTWWSVERGLEMGELNYQAQGWSAPRRIIVVRQHSVQKKKAMGKTMSLFADDPDLQGWRYGAMVTTLSLPALEIWRSYRGRADCENRIKELKADFGLDSFNVNDFYATEAALGFAMLAYNLMSLFRQAVLRGSVQHTLATLHHKVFAVGAFWHKDPDKRQLNLAVSRRRKAWFEGLWANAGNVWNDDNTAPQNL
jgi:hypothetical protein